MTTENKTSQTTEPAIAVEPVLGTGIYSYRDILTMKYDFMSKLNAYVLKNNEVTPAYYVAKIFVADLLRRSYRNNYIRLKLGGWFKSKSTLELKDLLLYTEFNDSDLIHFNAFSLLDSVACA